MLFLYSIVLSKQFYRRFLQFLENTLYLPIIFIKLLDLEIISWLGQLKSFWSFIICRKLKQNKTLLWYIIIFFRKKFW